MKSILTQPATEKIHKLKSCRWWQGEVEGTADNLREKASGTPKHQSGGWLTLFLSYYFTRNFEAQLEAGADSVHIHRRRKEEKKKKVDCII